MKTLNHILKSIIETAASAVFLYGCGNVATTPDNSFAEYIEAYTGGIVSSDNSIVIELAAPADGLQGNEAEINKASVFIALTDDDDTNITSAQIAKKVFNVPKVMARIYDEDKKPLLDKSGIETICPSILSESLITKFMEKKNEG